MTTVAITGAASGIGAAVRKRLEADGATVIGVDLRGVEIDADLANADGRQQAVAAIRAHATAGLDGVVACAGLGAHIDDFAAIASVNYFGAVELMDALRGDLEGRPGAAMVAVCSNSAQFIPLDDHPFVLAMLDGDESKARELIANENGFMAYAGSKHALCRAVRRRASEYGRGGVRLNGICPGTTQTPLLQGAIDHPAFGPGVDSLEIPLGHRAEPDDIARVIAFLLGPDAGYVHGSIVYADGGTDATMRADRF